MLNELHQGITGVINNGAGGVQPTRCSDPVNDTYTSGVGISELLVVPRRKGCPLQWRPASTVSTEWLARLAPAKLLH